MIRALLVLIAVIVPMLTGCAKQPVAFTPAELNRQNDGGVLFTHWNAYSGWNQQFGVATMDGWEDRNAYATAVRKQWYQGQIEMLPLQPVDNATRAAMAERLEAIGQNRLCVGMSPDQAVWAWGSPAKFERRSSSIGLEKWMYWNFSGGFYRRHAYFRNDRLLYWSDEP